MYLFILNKMKNFLFIIVAFFACISCEEKADMETLFLDKTKLEFPQEGGSHTFHIDCTTGWTVITPYPEEISINPVSGEGSQDVTVSIRSNSFNNTVKWQVSVRADNGITKGLEVIQAGSSGNTIICSNVTLNGRSGSISTSSIITTEPLELWGTVNKGPEWLEASFNGKDWFSTSKGFSGTGSTLLYFRATSNNDETDDRVAIFKVTSTHNSEVEFTVTQLGKNHNYPNVRATLPHAVAVDYEFGANVNSMFFLLTEKFLSYDELMDTPIEMWKGRTISDSTDVVLMSYDDLKENTLYHFYCFSFPGPYATHFNFTTPPVRNNYKVNIESINSNNTDWKWETVKSPSVTQYCVWVTEDQELFNTSDVILAWKMKTNLHQEVYFSDATHVYKGNVPFMIVTCVQDRDFYGEDIYVVNREIVNK